MEKIKTHDLCPLCKGDGTFETTSGGQPEVIDPCPSCLGVGYHEQGKLDDDLLDLLNDILDKVNDIQEKVNE